MSFKRLSSKDQTALKEENANRLSVDKAIGSEAAGGVVRRGVSRLFRGNTLDRRLFQHVCLALKAESSHDHKFDPRVCPFKQLSDRARRVGSRRHHR